MESSCILLRKGDASSSNQKKKKTNNDDASQPHLKQHHLLSFLLPVPLNTRAETIILTVSPP